MFLQVPGIIDIVIDDSVAKKSKKFVNLWVMIKNQKIQGKCTNIIKLNQTID